MLFNSLEFGLFFAACFGLYLLLPRRGQNVLLLVASYTFYAAWDWRFCGLLALSTVVDFWIGLALHRARPARRPSLLVASLATNLGILAFFKYAGFFADSLVRLAGSLGFELSSFTLDVVLPVGISFYTFQTLSYTIDIYRERLSPTRDFVSFALFVAFFPQLVAGPIERASTLLPQILNARQVTWDRIRGGGWLILWGLFKKVVVADNLGPLVDAVYAPRATPTGPEILLATYAFAFQIYCDFSGYTDMARGIARVMGFDLMLNFRLPYVATSPQDFWRRWHISLSTWLRDYLYISLGGNRKGSSRTYLNLGVTMLLGGLWHGAAWTFVIWGGYHGALLIAERVTRPTLSRFRRAMNPPRWAWRGLCVFTTFHLVCLGWLIFRAESLAQVQSLLIVLVSNWHAGLIWSWLAPFLFLLAPLLLMQLFQGASRDLECVRTWPFLGRTATYVFVIAAILLFGEDGGRPFVYFQF